MSAFQANIHFQSLLHQAKSWKSSHEKQNKDLEAAEKKVQELEKQLEEANKSLEEVRADLVVVTDQKERGIDAYMETPEFTELMEAHDALTHPISYKEGWDGAIEAILKRHPGVFSASDFPCPLAPQPSKAVIAEAARQLEEEDSSSFEEEVVVTPRRTTASSESSSGGAASGSGKTSSSSGKTASSSGKAASSGSTTSTSDDEPTPKKQKTAAAPS